MNENLELDWVMPSSDTMAGCINIEKGIAEQPERLPRGIAIAASENLGVGVDSLLCGETDPWGIGTPSHVAWGSWAARIWREMGSPDPCWSRKLFYASLGKQSPKGIITGDNWKDVKEACKIARDLGLIPADIFIDMRLQLEIDAHEDDPEDSAEVSTEVHPPEVDSVCADDFEVEKVEEVEFELPPEIEYPDVPEFGVERDVEYWETPQIRVDFDPLYSANRHQPFRVEVLEEKSEMRHMTDGLCKQYGDSHIVGKGDLSKTVCEKIVARAKRDGRPVIILYLTDFDDQGENMAHAVSVKIEALKQQAHLEGFDLDIKVKQLALTRQQCLDYNLPPNPVKPSKDAKKKSDEFRELHGVGETELDALETHHEGEVGRLLEEELKKYYVTDMEDQLREEEKTQREKLSDLQKEAIDETKILELESDIRNTWQTIVDKTSEELDKTIGPTKSDYDSSVGKIDDKINSLIEQVNTKIEERNEATTKFNEEVQTDISDILTSHNDSIEKEIQPKIEEYEEVLTKIADAIRETEFDDIIIEHNEPTEDNWIYDSKLSHAAYIEKYKQLKGFVRQHCPHCAATWWVKDGVNVPKTHKVKLRCPNRKCMKSLIDH